jgi:hypothetical protein
MFYKSKMLKCVKFDMLDEISPERLLLERSSDSNHCKALIFPGISPLN